MKQAGSGAKTVGSQDPEEPSPRRVAAGTEEEPKSDELAGRYYTVADLRQEDLEPPPTINSNDPNEDEGEQIDEEEHREENDDTKNDSRQDTEKTKDRENTNEEDDEEMDELRRDSDGLICYEEDEEEALRRIWRERCLSRKKSDGEDFNLYDEREEEVSPRERRRRNLPREENYDNDEIIIEEVDEKNLARRERQRRHIPRKKSYDDVITVEEVDKEELSRRERQRRLLPQTKRNQRNRPNQEAASRPTPETLSSEDPVSDGSTRRVPPPINQPSTTPLFTEPVQSPKPLARSATDLTLARGETSQAAEHLAVSLEPLGLESQVRLGVFQQLINLFRRGRRNPTTDVEKANGSSNHAAVTPKGLVLPPKLSLWRSNVDKTLVHVAEEEGLEIDMLKQLLECVLVFLKTHGPEVSVHNPPPNGVASADAAAEPSSNTTRPAKEPPTITVQKVLDHVYESGVLERPKIEGKKSTRKHLTALGTALSACNTWTFLTPGTDHFRSWAAGSLANLTISELLGDGKHRRDRDSDRDILSFISFGSKRSKYGTFTADDLDIGTLTDIGEIRIKWTCVAEDHLILDMGGSRYDDASSDGDGDGYGNSEPTLSLYWFDAVELSWLAAYVPERKLPSRLTNNDIATSTRIAMRMRPLLPHSRS